MTKRNWIFFLLLIGTCILILIFLYGVLKLDIFQKKGTTNYARAPKDDKLTLIDNRDITPRDQDLSDDTTKKDLLLSNLEDSRRTGGDTQKDEGALKNQKTEDKKRKQTSSQPPGTTKDKTSQNAFNRTNTKSTKTADLEHTAAYAYLEQSFDSLGEYVSASERSYRLELVNSLDIHTIVIDCLSEKNGISQEFFKIVYLQKMIPAKILERVVESKEFRTLIPPEYLIREQALGKFKNGDYVVFKKTELKRLLDYWCNGQLTPIQKAWSVGAEK